MEGIISEHYLWEDYFQYIQSLTVCHCISETITSQIRFKEEWRPALFLIYISDLPNNINSTGTVTLAKPTVGRLRNYAEKAV